MTANLKKSAQVLHCFDHIQIKILSKRRTVASCNGFVQISCRVMTGVGLALFLAGCAIFPWPSVDHKWEENPSDTNGTEDIKLDELQDGVFVGIAMSGGGSRAANFSVAALLELKSAGFLNNLTAISSVSGSSLTAGYYGMYANDPESHWNTEEIKRRFGANFDFRAISYFFNPWNTPHLWLTDFNRDDEMAGIFDNVLFERHWRQAGYSFNDMRINSTSVCAGKSEDVSKCFPKIVINATTLQGENFVFTNEKFKELNSSLASYPISYAIMASAAFPGAFNYLALRDFKDEQDSNVKEGTDQHVFEGDATLKDIIPMRKTNVETYKHLFDGGPSDNLGIGAILRIIKHLAEQSSKTPALKGCMIILIDAYASPEENRGRHKRDLRGLTGHFIDSNLFDSFDALLFSRRAHTLKEDLDYPKGIDKIGEQAVWGTNIKYGPIDIDTHEQKGQPCYVWHLSFQRLKYIEGEQKPYAKDIFEKVNHIKTDFSLGSTSTATYKEGGPEDLFKAELSLLIFSSEELQDSLFAAAQMLVRDDFESMSCVQSLFASWDDSWTRNTKPFRVNNTPWPTLDCP